MMKVPLKISIFPLLVGLMHCNMLFAAEYKVLVRANNGIEVATKKWQATIDYLTKNIPEHSFKLVPKISLKEIIVSGGKGAFDFVMTNPSSYVELKQRFGAEALVTLYNKRADKGQDKFGSVIFVHAASDDIITVNDLKNRTIMAVTETAFGGWRMVWLELLKQGIDPYKDFKSLAFAKGRTHAEVVFAVRDKKVDAGVVRTDVLERLEEDGQIDMRYFRILNNKEVKTFPFFLSTELYPEWPFASMKHVPVELVTKIKQVLLSVTKDNKAAIDGKYIGWVPAKSYKAVDELLKELKVGPYSLPNG